MGFHGFFQKKQNWSIRNRIAMIEYSSKMVLRALQRMQAPNQHIQRYHCRTQDGPIGESVDSILLENKNQHFLSQL